ncbi:MAG: oligopeptide/dipeptide ABC transporter ATP-binding protein [Steroidobacteraceae bacterium]
MSVLLQARNLVVSFDARGEGLFAPPVELQALQGVSLEMDAGQSVGVVGESGSGKSTLARTLLQLLPLTSGEVILQGENLAALSPQALRQMRRQVQMIFQDPSASLDPRMRVEHIVGEPLRVFEPQLDRAERRWRVLAMLARVDLSAQHLARFPHELSGGQAQRVAIARALIAGPKLLVCDEVLSALDVTLRAQVLELLNGLRVEQNLALLFIAHDLAAVRRACERALVLNLGRVMEAAPIDLLFRQPRHPYTRALLESAPIADPRRARARKTATLRGEPASPFDPPSGCVFRNRCPFAIERCALEVPVLRELAGSRVACHRAEEI